MDDAAREAHPQDAPPADHHADASPTWPSPPPQTVEHAVALLATTWSRARSAA